MSYPDDRVNRGWYVNGHRYGSFLDACERALYARSQVIDSFGVIHADYRRDGES